ncbi:MAG: PD40 domain-containing protein, partial [Anaerolineales bacterium]|nr:PD40 domain-containing protein [Anaerolineales bacterium]
MKLDRFDSIVLAVCAGLLALIAAVIALGDRVGVRVSLVQPAAGSEVSPLGGISLRFSEVMQGDTVTPRFSIEPNVAGDFAWQEDQLTFKPSQPFQAGVIYTAKLTPGATSHTGRAVLQAWEWQFRVRAPRVLFLSGQGNQRVRELWSIAATGGPLTQITQTEGRVYDYAVAPDGSAIVYTVSNEDRGTDLWWVLPDGNNARQLVTCGADICSVPAFSPTGQTVAFSREPAGITPGTPNGPPRVWTVDLQSGQGAALYQDSQVLGYGPVWSPNGQRLAFFDGSVNSIRMLDLETGTEMLVETFMGTVGSWSPDSNAMLFNNLNFETGQPYSSLVLADFAKQAIQPALGNEPNFADYAAPVWAPDGEWVAVALREPSVSSPGKQIWLGTVTDGLLTLIKPVTADSTYTHGGYRWNPAGTALVFQRFEIDKPFATPEVAVWDEATNTITPLAQDASLPEWLP